MSKLPQRFLDFQKNYPAVFEAYDSLGKAVTAAGPLSAKEMALVKIGIACGAKLEGGLHSHCRKALDAGLTREEIRQAVLLSTTTMGFPAMMACLSWVDDVLNEKK
ncbi:MAG: carboxymuconolactone decarboxylase family protein [Candidatus Melainabacteria bacterium]|jgi:alkylhydroperoxidase/carboxymuconolactone decarboxylase family protein YurZ|nr:carboxymuconolactone decarboxylase family protein [Candidatus Melainabacteria bacterium]